MLLHADGGMNRHAGLRQLAMTAFAAAPPGLRLARQCRPNIAVARTPFPWRLNRVLFVPRRGDLA